MNARIQDDDLIEVLLPYRQLKPTDEIAAEQNRYGHSIHDAIEQLGKEATVKQIAVRCGFPVERVKEHIEHHNGLKRPKFRVHRR